METSIIIPGLKKSALKACNGFNWDSTKNILLKWLKEDSLEYQQLMSIPWDSKNIIVDSCLYGYTELISVVIINKFPVNYEIKGNIYTFYSTMLNFAAIGKQLPLMKYLVLHGADVNHVSAYEYTALLYVLNSGLTSDILNCHGIYKTVIQNSQIDIVKFLLEAGSNVNGSSGKLPLCYAVSDGNIDFVKMLIDYGADVNKKDKFSNTALSYAVVQEHPQIIELLLNAGACMKIVYPKYCTILHVALLGDNQNVIELLLERGADVNGKNTENETPLYAYIFISKPICYSPVSRFVSENGINIVGTLVLWGADLNVFNDRGCNTLHWAAWQGSIPLVKLLIDRGLDVKDKLGKKPIHYASEAGHHKVVQYFIDYYCNKFM